MVTQSWFHNLWPRSKKQEPNGAAPRVAVLSFEAASLMAKLIHLWQSLSDKQVAKLREEISNSVGIRNLVSEKDDYIGGLICSEMTENVVHVAMAVSRLSKKCNDPLLRSFDWAFNDLMRNGGDTYGWRFSWKKMEKKVKKMERFVGANNNLYQAMETLADLEQALKRMKGSDTADGITLVEYEKKVVTKRQEVRRLKESSLWSRTYHYAVLLLARSLFTVYDRIGHVFGTNGVEDAPFLDTYNSRRGHSTIFLQSSVYPSESCVPKHASGGPGKFVSMSGPLTGKDIPSDFRSGPLARSMAASSPISESYSTPGFFSGPLKPTTNSEPVLKPSKSGFRLWQFRFKSHDGSNQKIARQKSKGVTMSGPLTGGVISSGAGFPMGDSYSYSIDVCAGALDETKDTTGRPRTQKNMSSGDRLFVASRNKLLNPPPGTLGASALAVHYANVIVFIEKLVASPRLIGQDARDDLYNMLPSSVRAALRAKLKPSSPKSLTSSPCPMSESNESMSEILEWLAPLAHNMIRWQSMRSIEHQSFISKANVLLVQTLFFADQEKTEAAIVDLLVGLNNIWRFGRETDPMAHQVNDGRLD